MAARYIIRGGLAGRERHDGGDERDGGFEHGSLSKAFGGRVAEDDRRRVAIPCNPSQQRYKS